MATPLDNDAWTAQTEATIEQTLGEIFDALAPLQNVSEAADLLTPAGPFKDATAAWRSGAHPLTLHGLDALLDDVAALYGDVVALARRSTILPDRPKP